MPNLVIECPECGRFLDARTGLFSRKVTCSCGEVIKLKAELLHARQCQNCEKLISFARPVSINRVCPSCGKPMDSRNVRRFTCGMCGLAMEVSEEYLRTHRTMLCPLCSKENDLIERIKKNDVRNDNIADVLKLECDNDVLVFKHPIEDFNIGSQLIVHESQQAVFFRDGRALDLFPPGRHSLNSQQIPMLDSLVKLPTNPNLTFHCEVYFINTSTILGIPWGLQDRFSVRDSRSGMYFMLGARGTFNIRVADARRLLQKVVGTTSGLRRSMLIGGAKAEFDSDGSLKDQNGLFRSMIVTNAKQLLPQIIEENSLDLLSLSKYYTDIAEQLRVIINDKLGEYGLFLPELFIEEILLPEEDANFRKLRDLPAAEYLGVQDVRIKQVVAREQVTLDSIKAQGEANVKVIGAQADAEAFRLRSEAEAADMRRKGYSYEQQTQREVMLEAMKNGISGGPVGKAAELAIAYAAAGGTLESARAGVESLIRPGGQNQVAGDSWICPDCGKTATGKFCNECGRRRPAPAAAESWICPKCGNTATGKFCNECGQSRNDA